eukprot:ANDGO_00584.mRNA.1 hypothetical protein
MSINTLLIVHDNAVVYEDYFRAGSEMPSNATVISKVSEPVTAERSKTSGSCELTNGYVACWRHISVSSTYPLQPPSSSPSHQGAYLVTAIAVLPSDAVLSFAASFLELLCTWTSEMFTKPLVAGTPFHVDLQIRSDDVAAITARLLDFESGSIIPLSIASQKIVRKELAVVIAR